MFRITKHQYDLIMQHVQSCYPQEAGGILGGKEDLILGVLPIPNQFLYDRTVTFGLTRDDIDRGFAFLRKHELDYLGVYHSHPTGAPYPSEKDLEHRQKYHFIISLQDRYNPEFAAYEVVKGKPVQVPIQVMDEGFTVLDLHPERPKLSQAAPPEELVKLADMINTMILGRDVEYPKEPPKWDASTFSTEA